MIYIFKEGHRDLQIIDKIYEGKSMETSNDQKYMETGERLSLSIICYLVNEQARVVKGDSYYINTRTFAILILL